jgi:hypothetical protein
MTPAKRLSAAAFEIRSTTNWPAWTETVAALLEEEAAWAADRADTYPPSTPCLTIAEAIMAAVGKAQAAS